jgi:hypothetical protein
MWENPDIPDKEEARAILHFTRIRGAYYRFSNCQEIEEDMTHHQMLGARPKR